NLVGNALRHASSTDTHLAVNIRAGQNRSQEIWVQVEDSGLGLSEEALERAFDRFYSSQAGQGGGLGLAIVETLVNLHGGRVSAANTLAGGAQFTVKLPSSHHKHPLQHESSRVDATRRVA
ncbi:MAG: ATP-binding protein, partial [Deinococcota bacterium]